MKTITLKEIEELEHKCNVILRPMVIDAIKRFMVHYVDKNSAIYPKALQLVTVQLHRMYLEFNERDLLP